MRTQLGGGGAQAGETLSRRCPGDEAWRHSGRSLPPFSPAVPSPGNPQAPPGCHPKACRAREGLRPISAPLAVWAPWSNDREALGGGLFLGQGRGRHLQANTWGPAPGAVAGTLSSSRLDGTTGLGGWDGGILSSVSPPEAGPKGYRAKGPAACCVVTELACAVSQGLSKTQPASVSLHQVWPRAGPGE